MKAFSLIVTAATLAVTNADEYFTGDATAYTLGQTSAGNCNMMSALDFATTDYAALNNEQWDGLQNCGRCAEVSCADDRCADQSTSVVVQILDRCPECKQGDLDLSPSVFKTLTGSHPSRYTIKWKFVDCPVSGNVNYCLKGGSNNYWMGVQPTNCATGVKSLKINGQDTTMLGSAYYYLLDGASQVQTDLTSLTISLTDVNGNSIEDTVSLTADSCTEGANQFPSGGSTSQSSPTQQSPPTTTSPKPTTATPTTAPPTQAPTQTQTPTPTPTPTQTPAPTTQTPSPTTDSETASESDDGLQLFNVTGTVEPVATTAPKKSGKTSSKITGTSSATSDDEYTHEQEQTQQNAGVPAATTAAPSAEQTADSQDGDDDAQKVTTKTQESSGGTDPLIIALSTLGAVGVVALIVVVVMAKRKNIQEEKAQDMEAHSMVSVQSFDVQNTPSDRRHALAGIL
ncbi:hypothetical protein PC129_g10701 [Phytophthora cactorum]|nr:hypothetical protein PC111_g12534 [Phytophthora cactorum]KAG2817879.1 hypothetical protein PC112_g12869 [Phytophthora cactorum]KAG2854033.1 hypothetical protein PC113_g13670 [Phytophthora cactorum]KAG2898564.1 hypothetical protein PC114_g14251 [Phytophthora cactorum]KAG2929127.1 hypothetical protein PC117_g14080 [Phytophthora cactorum]